MDRDVIYRSYRSGDADGIIGVIREIYGDDYFNADCYEKSYIESSAADGRRIIFVAELDNSIIGVTNGSYMGCFPGSYEVGLHAMKREYQGHGYAKKLLAYSVESLRKMKIFGVYGMAVTFHSRSQAESEEVGLVGTGLWLGRHRADRRFFSEKPKSDKLHSLMVAACGTQRNKGAAFAPRSHRDFIASVYDALGAPCVFGADAGYEAEKSSVYIRETADAFNHELFVRSMGSDAYDRVDSLISGASGADSYTLFLNMLDGGMEDLYPKLLSRGFYFTGIAPLHEGCEFLIMHREGARGYVWDEMALTEKNAAIRDYVQSNRGL